MLFALRDGMLDAGWRYGQLLLWVKTQAVIGRLDYAVQHECVLKNPTVDQLKSALDGGALIIIPAAGQQLGNPYFQQPGPKYHMLMIRGYTVDGHAITNDPGTRRGEAYVYKWETLLNAVHDWNGGDVENGENTVAIISRYPEYFIPRFINSVYIYFGVANYRYFDTADEWLIFDGNLLKQAFQAGKYFIQPALLEPIHR
jgi:hypothetical protein